ncbi:hypothetical protein ACOSQ2_006416 [Xanthoceras sorbifolium]
MSSPSDRRRHKASTGGSSNKGGRRLRSFNDALIDYERFMFDERTGHRSYIYCGSFIMFFWEHGESEGFLLGIEERDDSSLAASGGLDAETESSSFPLSGIIKEILVELVHTFHLPRVHKVLIPRVTVMNT